MNVAARADSAVLAAIANIGDGETRVIPRATYRLQLRRECNFAAVKQLLPYLSALGISHLYLSPIFEARPGSPYGYDVINHSAINPELGTLTEFKELSAAARGHGLGIILDIVPNHMAVMTNGNEWWLDVLENGPASKFSEYFDIDWTPLRKSMRNRLLVPILENRYGSELSEGRIQVRFDAGRGAFNVFYNENRFPLDPQTYPRILAGSVPGSPASRDELELQSIIDGFASLPTRCDTGSEHVARRYRDKETLKDRLMDLCASHLPTVTHIKARLMKLNGEAGNPASLDALADLLSAQPYRLAYWKVAGDEINYRRFFDVNQLAALRADKSDVFAATHELVLDLLRDGCIDGLRVDHIDGLHDPHKYLARLRQATTAAAGKHCYIVVEKILADHERLRDEWPVEGTTGYEFSTAITTWLITERGLAHLEWSYRQFIRSQPDFTSIVYESKKLLMRTSLAAEIAVLGAQLDRIAQAHRDTADFTQFALRDALTEVIAAFPVYRTYIPDCGADTDDAQSITWAVGAARARSKASDRTIYDFIEDVLLCRPRAAFNKARHLEIVDFTRKFQQVTAPVNAKSVEDTAFYRYYRLLAMNEVGGNLRCSGISTAALHRTVAERAKRWPHSMLTTSTHDSKRGEDVRYRLCALTELPKQWRQFSAKLSRLNRSKHVDLDNDLAPSRNDEYMLMQTLAGVWPAPVEANAPQIIDRVKQYAVKAVREGKEKSSWIDPDSIYESALLEFIDGYIAKPRYRRFLALLREIVEPLAFFGALNAAAAITLKLTVPGVPDFYQGTEACELTLVDPDNRRLIDFDRLATLNEQFLSAPEDSTSSAPFASAATGWRDGELKMFLTRRLLQLRRTHVALFDHGNYEPLEVHGERAAHLCAFARNHGDESVVVVVSRWNATLTDGRPVAPLGLEIWADTRIALPARMSRGRLLDTLTLQPISKACLSETGEIAVADLFRELPIAVLHWSDTNPSG